MTALWIGVPMAVLAAILYWLIISTEGTYLGPRVVALLYDWSANRYDQIKQISFLDEVQYIGLPLAERLDGISSPLVLDVACGTARVAQALKRGTTLDAYVIGIDSSRHMLAKAEASCEDLDLVEFLMGDAAHLPIADETCDCLVCLEALEFFGKADAALSEFMRVLRPGGCLLVSNRVGIDARSFPGRLAGRGLTEQRLTRVGFDDVQTERWQVHYDIIWAQKLLADRSEVE